MLTYKGHPVRRILFLGNKVTNRPLYYVETTELSCIVPRASINAEGGSEEVMRVARESRGEVLGR